MKIRNKIILSLLVVVLIGGSFALYFSNKFSQQALKDSIGENSVTLAQQAIDSVDRIIYRRIERWQSYIDSRPRIIELLNQSNQTFQDMDNRQEVIAERDNQWIFATNDEMITYMSEWTDEQLSQNLRDVVDFYETQYDYKLFPEVFITNKFGLNIAQTNRTTDYYQADEDWWQQTKNNGLFIIDADYDESAGMYSLGLCIRIDDEQGNFLGVIKIILNLQEIISIINDIGINTNLNVDGSDQQVVNPVDLVEFNLVNSKGNLIYSTQSVDYQYLEKISDEIITTINSNKNLRYFTYLDDENGEEELYSFANSLGYRDYKGLGWIFILEQKTSDVYAPVKDLGWNLGIVIAGSSILAIIVGYFVSKIITKPIDILKKSTEIIKKGDLNHQATISSNDEIGDFSRAFNQMTEAIKKSRRDVDKKVKEQTKEITNQRDKLQGQQRAILNILDDVEREKSNAERYADDLKKFQLAVANASDHIAITDLDGKILFANEAVEKITGFTNKEIINQKVGSKKLWGGLMPKEFYKKMWKTIKINKKIFNGVINNRRKNGEKYIAFASISPVLNINKEVQFFVGIERDITKEKQIDQAKTEFVSLASHQLRTPLSAINWYTEMILAGDVGKLNKELKEYLEEIYDSNHRMIDLVNSLLNVSRIELGTFAIDSVKVDLKQVINGVEKELEQKISSKKLLYKKNISQKVPKNYIGDKKLLNIIFQNLLSNAVKYTPDKGKINLTVGVKETKLIITVEDTGYGIPKKAQHQIFQKLFRADNIREKDTDGTGLGLYIIKAIVEQSKGKIWFESKENKGTKFFIELPLSGMKKKEGSKPLS